MFSRRKTIAFVETIAVFAWLLLCIWFVMPGGSLSLQITAIVATVLFVSLSQFLRRETWRTMGLDARWFLPSLWRAGAIALPGTGGMWLAGYLNGSAGVGVIAFFVIAFFYAFWGLVQQYLFLSYFSRRLRIFSGDRIIVALVTAAMFSVVHLPIVILAAATFIFGFVAAFIFYERPNLYALALAHGLLGAAFYCFLPDTLTGRLEGGSGLLQIPFDILHHISRL